MIDVNKAKLIKEIFEEKDSYVLFDGYSFRFITENNLSDVLEALEKIYFIYPDLPISKLEINRAKDQSLFFLLGYPRFYSSESPIPYSYLFPLLKTILNNPLFREISIISLDEIVMSFIFREERVAKKLLMIFLLLPLEKKAINHISIRQLYRGYETCLKIPYDLNTFSFIIESLRSSWTSLEV